MLGVFHLAFPGMAATSHVWLPETWDATSSAEEVSLYFYLMLMDLYLSTLPVKWINCPFCVGLVAETPLFDLERSSPLSWRPPFVFIDTHALVSLLQNLNKANYHLPIMVTDSGKPPMTNITDLRVQVCSCKNSKVDCNTAGAPHFSTTAVLLLSFFSLARKLTKLQCMHSTKT